MMMTTRNDIKDRLIHNQSPYPTKDKVLSYTIPVDHSETLLYCGSNSGGSSSSSSTSSSGSSSANNNQDNGSLSFITSDDDPCNGRDSLASFLDEGLGTSLDGVDEISSPIFPTLGRNDSGVFSSDEGARGVPAGTTKVGTVNSGVTHNNHANLIPRPKFRSTSSLGGSSASTSANSNNNITSSIAEVVSWKAPTGNNGTGSGTTSTSSNGSILLSPSGATATISLVTDSVTGIPSIICTSTAAAAPPPPISIQNNNSNITTNSGSNSADSQKTAKQITSSLVNNVVTSVICKGNTSQQGSRNKSMPLGRQGPQKCTICDKVFSNASALTKHKLTHSDERRHACATCGKAFKRQDHLNGHMLTHRNKKPFECKSKGCGKSYCDARSLRRHVENRHGHEVLESMNLTSHKHGNKNSHSSNSHNSGGSTNNNHNSTNEPQPELMHISPVKVEPTESRNSSPKILDCMPVLQPEPQLQLETGKNSNNVGNNSSRDKAASANKKGQIVTLSSGHGIPPPVLQKIGESNVPSTSGPSLASPSLVSGGVPVVVKRENVSVFDFDESMEDTGPNNVTFTPTPPPVSATLPPQQEKLLSSAIKVSSIVDSSKLGPFADIRLIQEWTKRLGDSKVALFLASSTAGGPPSIAQFSGPVTSASFQLDGQNTATGTVAMSGSSHAFIPTSENGVFSVTPISIVPTSSGEFTFKPATLSSVPASSTDPPKPIYILPPEPLLSTGIPPIVPIPQVNPTPRRDSTQSTSKAASKESKSKSEHAKEKKSGIGASLANRIKTKLKAGNLKTKLGKSESKTGREKGSSHHNNNRSGSPAFTGKSDDGHGGKSSLLLPQLQLPTGVPTISIAAGVGSGGIVSWCESPRDSLMNGVEDDPLSEGGADGEDKPVECSICCRRFKNTPALNGHMRLHGGYFKKETEGPKKKEVSKEHTHSTPLQTASVSVRALIEEKIKERRNNLLKLAAAAAAEKAAAGESSSSLEPLSQQPLSSSVVNSKSKSEKGSNKSSFADSKPNCSSTSANILVVQQAQQQLQQPCIKLSMENIKLKMEPTSSTEKDKNCDHHQLINTMSSNSSNTNSNGNISSSSNHNSIAAVSLEPSFQDLSILIGGDGPGNIAGIGGGGSVGGRIANGASNMTSHNNDILLPQLARDTTVHHHPQQQQHSNILQQSVVGSNNGSLPLTMDKSNIALLDCGIIPDELCQAFHLIYVDGMGNVTNGNSNMFSFSEQDTIGKMNKGFHEPLPEMSSLNCGLMTNNHSTLKSVTEPILVCPSNNQDDPCNLPWEWRNSTSSDNTDNSLSNVQDCVNSLLCSTSSDTPDESSTKDPVAGGGFCYTPILSPNSSFCLTPGPDSPFEAVAPPNQSLSFICPSPSIGNGSSYSDPSMSSLVNPPSSVEPIFSPDQSQPPSINSMNITPTAELHKYSHLQQQPELQNPIFINGFDGLHHNNKGTHQGGILTVSQLPPVSLSQPIQANFSSQLNETSMNCLPPINTFPTMQINGAQVITNGTSNFLGSKDIVLHCPNNNYTISMQQQSFVPLEVFTPFPLPKKIVDKWLNGKVEKGRKIRVGSEYQADLPTFKGKRGRNKAYRCLDEKLWDPTIFDLCTFEEVDKYLEFACCSAVPGGGMNKEYALHLLTFSKGNIREALLRLMEKLPTLPAKLRSYSYAENQRWSSEEIMAFQIALIQIGKDFIKISKAIGTKSGNECVCFYYFWKKVCPSEYQVMKQIWRDRLEHQKQLQQSQQQNFNLNNSNNINATLSNNNIISYISNNNNNTNGTNNLASNNVSFLVPAQDFRSK